MDFIVDIQWTKGAWHTFNRLPGSVQRGLITLLNQQIPRYAAYYQELAKAGKALHAQPHIHVPDWTIWLRMQAHYEEDEAGPILFIYGLEELSQGEFEQSRTECQQVSHRLNPRV